MSKKILAIEPDDALLRLIRIILSEDGYEVTSDYSDEQSLPPDTDLILVDVAMPVERSLGILSSITKIKTIPILAMSATADAGVRHATLESGADDFISLPFEPDEFPSYFRFLFAEQEEVDSGRETLIAGRLEIDFNQRTVRVNGGRVNLSYSEWVLLEILANPPGRPCLTPELLTIWGPTVKHDHEFAAQWIQRLQRKLGCDPLNPRLIRPYHDVGYVLTV